MRINLSRQGSPVPQIGFSEVLPYYAREVKAVDLRVYEALHQRLMAIQRLPVDRQLVELEKVGEEVRGL